MPAGSLHLSPCGRGRIASLDAIRVRGYGLTIGCTPHPNPLPQGERELAATAFADQSHLTMHQIIIRFDYFSSLGSTGPGTEFETTPGHRALSSCRRCDSFSASSFRSL